VGENVEKFAVGDAVYGLTLGGQAAAEYVLIKPKYIHSIAHKPPYMSFEDAACLTSPGHTIVQTLLRADSELEGGLKGKTVLVPAGLVSIREKQFSVIIDGPSDSLIFYRAGVVLSPCNCSSLSLKWKS
jgi:hypothetical protein